MKKILIIKTGATGDVVRTTVLLHAFKDDEVTWITAGMNKCVLPERFPALVRVLDIENVSSSTFQNQNFDLVLSLDDDKDVVAILSHIKYEKLTGAFWDTQTEKMNYTEDSAAWFDLSLISRYSKEIADRMKFEANKSVQEYLYGMLGKTFIGEEYLIPEDVIRNPNPHLIGIEARAGARWKSKRWHQYELLAAELEQEGYQVRFFVERKTLKEYMMDIAQCSVVVTGDTLAMHFALALKIPTVAIFTCTSPSEIYAYQRMEKVVSPHLWDAFYKTDYIPQAVESITLETVFEAVEKVLDLSKK